MNKELLVVANTDINVEVMVFAIQKDASKIIEDIIWFYLRFENFNLSIDYNF